MNDDPNEWEYEMYCWNCRSMACTYPLEGTTCYCGRLDPNWMRAHKREMYQRSESKRGLVRRFKPETQ